MDILSESISRVLVLGAEPQSRAQVVNALLERCGHKSLQDAASQGVHNLLVKTRYYTAELELHVHAVQENELLTPLLHDADCYEAMLWVVDAASDKSFLETKQFVENSIEELDFQVSMLIGADASSASNEQLRTLEKWGQDNAFEFVAVTTQQACASGNQSQEEQEGEDDSLKETCGMDRVLEALQCNMWKSMKTLKKDAAAAVRQENAVERDEEDNQEEDAPPASKILVLGASMDAQHTVVAHLAQLSGGQENTCEGALEQEETVHEMTLSTKYYEADVQFHLHRIDTNEIVTALHHDIDSYEALLWVVDASSDRSFLEAKQFMELSMEELSFDVSMMVATRTNHATPAQRQTLEAWCHENAFEFVSATRANSQTEGEGAAIENEGMDRVLEALHCNMWRSMRMLDRSVNQYLKPEEPKEEPVANTPNVGVGAVAAVVAIEEHSPSPPAVASVASPLTEPSVERDNIHASLASLVQDADDPDMEVFSGLLSQVKRIRDTSGALSDQERRRQAEQMAMQLWNLLGADEDSDTGGVDSDSD